MPDNNPFNQEDLPKMNNDLDLPKTTEEKNQVTSNNPFENNSKPNKEVAEKIEIPQSYYDKLAKEEHERKEKELAEEQHQKEVAEASATFHKFTSKTLLNAVAIFIAVYLTINNNSLIILAVPIFIVLLTIINAIREKKESSYPTTLLVGGIIVAVITFIVSMINVEQMDIWTHYSIMSVAIGFIGALTSNIITKIITSYKEIKALEFVAYFLYFIILIGVPVYLEKSHHEEFHRYVFLEQVEVHAETEEEFILKTLKARYNQDFVCSSKITYQIDETNRKRNERTCQDANEREITVISKVYNETENRYIIIDNYLDILYLNSTKTELNTTLKSSLGVDEVIVYLYPEKNCTFYADCAECEEYYQRHDEEINADNQYKESTNLNFSKYLNQSSKDFINNNKLKYVISVTGTFNAASADYNNIINTIFNYLNNNGYKNTYGYVISVYNYNESSLGDTSKLVYKVKGSTNDNQTFKDPEVVDVSANKTNNNK